jgi:hypothetical protein
MFFKHKPKRKKWEVEKEKLLKAHAFKEFLSKTGEWRALWMGFYSAWYKVIREKLPDYLRKDIENEFHYYTLGFFIGRAIQAILIICGVGVGI